MAVICVISAIGAFGNCIADRPCGPGQADALSNRVRNDACGLDADDALGMQEAGDGPAQLVQLQLSGTEV
jgi:hypothetical protein